jgi:hypothetical protein
MVMSGADYRESLRRCRPTVYVNGRQIESVADDSQLAPGIRGIALTYDLRVAPGVRAGHADGIQRGERGEPHDGAPAHQFPICLTNWRRCGSYVRRLAARSVTWAATRSQRFSRPPVESTKSRTVISRTVIITRVFWSISNRSTTTISPAQ